PQTTALNRRWVVGQSGEMYHFDFFDPLANRFSRLRVYHFDSEEWRLRAMTYAEDAVPDPGGDEDVSASPLWTARHGWRREFSPAGQKRPESVSVRYSSF